MKYRILIVSLFISIISYSQIEDIQKSVYSIQTGLLGVWFSNETNLSNKLFLKSEIGLDSGFFGGVKYNNGNGFMLTPVITIEPRYYYNLTKRKDKSLNTKYNSANFISLKLNYNPDWFIISNYKNISLLNQISIIPTWGIKRNIYKHLQIETGAGLGYRYIFKDNYKGNYSKNKLLFNFHLRLGYSF